MIGYAILGMFLVLCVFMYYSLINNPLKTIIRMQRFPSTRGKITAIDTENPELYDIYKYEYSVNGKTYQGFRSSCLSNFQFKNNSPKTVKLPAEVVEFRQNHTEVGQEVEVYYNPSNPEEAYLIKLKRLPKEAWANYYKFVIFGTLAMVALIPTTLYEIYMKVQHMLLS